MKKSITEAAEMYAVDSISLSQLVKEIEKHYPHHQVLYETRVALEYAEHYAYCCDAAMAVGTEVLIDTPYDTFSAFVMSNDGEYVIVDHNGKTEKYHVSCIQETLDMCDE